MPESIPPQDFAAVWHQEGGSPAAVARRLGVHERAVYSRRARLVERGYDLATASGHIDNDAPRHAYAPRVMLYVEDGSVVVWSDRHRWPGDGITPAEAALLALLPALDPVAIISNGDELDGARASKHPPLGWERKPDMASELAEVQVGLRRIAEHAPRAKRFRTVGNHCRRYDYHLSKSAPDYRGIVGMRLSDHLPDWSESWSVHINPETPGGAAVVKHKIGNGVTAGRTNAIKAGVTIVTGHTHRLSVDAVETYAGRHYGVQTGTLGHPRGAHAEYAEDNPDAGRAGFVVLTWRAGVLQPPELCEVDDAGVAWFRGEPVTVKPRVRVQAGRAAA
jgi:hypothetical protein